MIRVLVFSYNLFWLPLCHGLDCTIDSDCNLKYSTKSSVCGENGTCTNPFEKGCLRTMAQIHGATNMPPLGGDRKFKKEDEGQPFSIRVCNSDDTATIGSSSATDSCKKLEMESYKEIRIASGNWDQSMAIAWVYQILLSEILGVPTVIEANDDAMGRQISFYGRESLYDYANQTYPIKSLVEADNVDGDCSLSDQPCAHVLPDVWAGGMQDAAEYQKNGSIFPGGGNGVLGNFGHYAPKLLLQEYSSLSSLYGLSGEGNREKLAELFKAPTTWGYYCAHISNSTCEEDDGIATRAPSKAEEGDYFVKDAFKGHFREDNISNCKEFRDTCRGHVVVGPCDWTVYSEAQLYWNNISLTSNGPHAPNGGYDGKSIKQIYYAANATRSPVIFWWWDPEELAESFQGTDYELIRVSLSRRPSMECLAYRANGGIQRCSNNLEDRLGEPIGACDHQTESMQKLVSRGLVSMTESQADAVRNPALDFLKFVVLPPYAMDRIFAGWRMLKELDEPVTDVKREGICSFVYENLDHFLHNIPPGYPRKVVKVEHYGLSVFALIMGSVTLIATAITVAMIYMRTNKQVMKLAFIETIYATVIGYSLIAMAALTAASRLTDITCTATQWLTRLGYTVGMIPILIKVTAINKLSRDGHRFQRTTIDRKKLRQKLFLSVFSMISYLVIWTVIDRPRYELQYGSRGNVNDFSNVNQYDACSSKSVIWETAAFGWEATMLISATVLAFQSREVVIDDMNHSRSLAFMVYSHSLFLGMRILTTVLMFVEKIPSSLSLIIVSLLQSFDMVVALCIYIVPMIFEAYQKPEKKAMKPVLVKGKNGKSRRFISGVNIPSGGIPNLIDSSRSLRNTSRSRLPTQNTSTTSLNQQSARTLPIGAGAGDRVNSTLQLSSSQRKLPARHSSRAGAGDRVNSTLQLSSSQRKLPARHSSLASIDEVGGASSSVSFPSPVCGSQRPSQAASEEGVGRPSDAERRASGTGLVVSSAADSSSGPEDPILIHALRSSLASFEERTISFSDLSKLWSNILATSQTSLEDRIKVEGGRDAERTGLLSSAAASSSDLGPDPIPIPEILRVSLQALNDSRTGDIDRSGETALVSSVADLS